MSVVSKQHILNEIRRTAEANDGVPLGRAKFFRETGIKNADWLGKIWSRWGDALLEAGFQPNQFQAAHDDDFLMEKFIDLLRELGRFPVSAEVKIKARSDSSFPSHSSFTRFGPKHEFVAKILEFCQERTGYVDVSELCVSIAAQPTTKQRREEANDGQATKPDGSTKEGYVYMALLRLGRERRYKIGKAVLVERRTDQISVKLPENLELIHTISTDDAYGIEYYWHKRFKAKNTQGEWFSLSGQDIDAFKRRKVM
jgi:hypothetical protein